MGLNNNFVSLQIKEEGEIAARLAGDKAFEGYWHRPESDARALRDGWFLTGDNGYFDADGDLFVTGRVDDMIITGGENVSPGVEVGLEHRRPGTGRQTGDRRQSRFLFRVRFDISLARNFRIAPETARFALPEQTLGQTPGSGGSARLQKSIGITRTKDMVMRSRRIPAKQAYDWGIVTEVVPDSELEATTGALVKELREFAPLAQRTSKKLLNGTEDASLSIAIELEGHCYSRLRSSDDFREGVAAFHEKRAPQFQES